MFCHKDLACGVYRGVRHGETSLPKRSELDEEERELIRQLYPSLRRIAAVAGPVDVEPDDLVQEALVRVLRKQPLTQLEHPLGYLRRTIINLASNQRRSAARRRKAIARLDADEVQLPSYPADIEAILDLPPRQRAILYLIEVEDVPYAEAAEQLGMTAATARQLASRARRKARVTWEAANG